MAEPRGDERGVERRSPSPCAFLGRDRHRRVHESGVSLVEHEQVGGAGRAVRARRLGRVVQPQHGGRGAAPQDAPAGVEPGRHVGEGVRRRPLCRRERVQPEPCTRDHPERALGADEELGEIGPDGGCRSSARAHDATVGEHDLEPGHHLFDLAVARRELAGRPARQPPADGRQLDRLRPVTERVTARPQVGFEHVPEGAGKHLERQALVVDRHDAAHRSEVEQHAAGHRYRRPADPRATTGRRHRHAGGVAHGEHRTHLAGIVRPHHHRGRCRDAAVVDRPRHRHRPPVTARLATRRRIGIHGRAGCGERVEHDRGDLDPRTMEAIGRSVGWADELDRRRRSGAGRRHRPACSRPPGPTRAPSTAARSTTAA